MIFGLGHLSAIGVDVGSGNGSGAIKIGEISSPVDGLIIKL